MKRDIIKLLLLIFIPLLSITRAYAQLSDSADISIITVSPSDEEVYTLYGHTSLRVKDSVNKIDLAFNYGIFDFSKPNFIYRFTKGETDYRLEAYPFSYFISEYEMRGGEVVEQVLNLSSEEKNRIWDALLVNMRPENKVYRYNFFFDNCATRPLDIISKGVNGELIAPSGPSGKSFRDIINYSTRNHPWLTFGCDLALGAPTDTLISKRDELFLPKYTMEGIDKSEILSPNGELKPLVFEKRHLTTEAHIDRESGLLDWATPNVVCWSFLVITLLITIYQWKTRKYNPTFDCLLFFAAGLGGVVLWFLCFVSTHPCTSHNWNILWLQPFDLFAVILFIVKRLRKMAFYYHFINFATLTAMLLGWSFIPQHLNVAFLPLVISIWIRSGYGIYREIWNTK